MSTFTDSVHELHGIPFHLQQGGNIESLEPVLMIHGSGPGVSTAGNWQRVIGPLAERFHVFATDLIGFGRSGRKSAPPFFDVELWLEQCRAVIAQMPGERIGLIGHSLGGALALRLAASEARVSKVMTTATLGAPFPMNEAVRRVWTFPADRAALRDAAQCLIADHALIDEAYLSAREKILFDGDYQRYFSAMFEGEKQRYIDRLVLDDDELACIHADVLMLHGRDDPGFPPDSLTLALSRSLPHADVALLAHCSHSIAYEQPGKFLLLANAFFGGEPGSH
ncbi:putative hydrolase or acyltransferase of alpha/beta superfamily [Burkholderia sp. Ch1-1]|nr:putative hydrolase or acyltransferase of alpha/beta superfamily [Burkholderia sp. Ch1-1]